jgi:hypothetical protein
VFRAAETGLLNPGEAEKALGWVADQKDANNVKFMQKLNGRVMSIKAGMTADPKWAAQGELSAAVQMEVVNRATQRANELRRTGERGEDPNQIFNPNSKEYMFQPEMLNTIANDIRASVRRTPQFPDPNDPVLKALPAGSNFLDANGVMRVVPQRAPGPQKATVMDIAAGYVTPVPRAGGFTIDAPQRSSVHALNGKRYATREEAMAAIQQHYDTIK